MFFLDTSLFAAGLSFSGIVILKYYLVSVDQSGGRVVYSRMDAMGAVQVDVEIRGGGCHIGKN